MYCALHADHGTHVKLLTPLQVSCTVVSSPFHTIRIFQQVTIPSSAMKLVTPRSVLEKNSTATEYPLRDDARAPPVARQDWSLPKDHTIMWCGTLPRAGIACTTVPRNQKVSIGAKISPLLPLCVTLHPTRTCVNAMEPISFTQYFCDSDMSTVVF